MSKRAFYAWSKQHFGITCRKRILCRRYLLRRSTGRHTWSVDERYFERQAEQRWDGLALGVAGVCPVDEPLV